MANPAPTINQINAFNATQGTTIDFNIIGGTELVRSNRIYIYDLSDNSLICTHLYVSTESIHELPPNTDGSIVYESGKSSADFVNGAQYYAQIQTFTDIAGTQGGSGLSVSKLFWCLVDPSLTIDTIPSSISTTSYNVSATYNANTSVVSNIIQQYQFSLYSATGSLLQSSGVVVGNGEQQGTSTAYDISYNFTGLSVGSSYYTTVEVTTTQGMSVSAQSGTFTVSIDTPTLGEATVVNNACDGYISVTSNLSSEYGGSGSGDIVSFETDSENVFSKLQVTFSPTQTGSGTASPDNVRPIYGVGGVDVDVVGKNLLPFPYAENTITRNGITWTVNDDGTITANGTSTGVSWFDVITASNIYYPKQQVRVSGCPNGGSASTYRVYINVKTKQGTNAGYTDTGSGSNVLDVAEINQLRLQISSTGFVANNLTFKPMIRGSNITDSTYEPYTEQAISQEFDVSLTPTSKDTDPYLFKAVGDIYGDRLEEELVGGTVNWNQLASALDSTHWSNAVSGTTNVQFSNGVASFLGTVQYAGLSLVSDYRPPSLKDHKYFFSVTAKAESNANLQARSFGGYGDINFGVTTNWTTKTSIFNLPVGDLSLGNRAILLRDRRTSDWDTVSFKNVMLIDLTQMLGSTIADYIYSLEQATAGSGIAWLKSYGFFTEPYYEYDAGTLKSVNPTAHVTRGVNAWDEEWELGTIDTTGNPVPSNATIRSKNFISVLPNQTYYYKGDKTAFIHFYDADKNWISMLSKYNETFAPPSNGYYIKFRLSSGTTYNNDICINISDPTINGKYFPYEAHTYDLGNVPLYGLFQLENGKLKAYGDVRHAVGGTDRKFALVDLGSLNWTYQSANTRFYSDVINDLLAVASDDTFANIVSEKYTPSTTNRTANQGYDKIIATSTSKRVFIKDTDYTTASALKTALSGVYIVCEKATATTEDTPPFTQVQEVSKYGTLEYITTNGIPVGHNTTYLTRDIFGGTLDLVSGRLVVTHKTILLDGTEDLWIEYPSYETQICYLRNIFENAVPKKLLQPSWGISNYMQCVTNILAGTITAGQMSNSTANSGKNLYLTYPSGISSLSAWKTYLATHPLQLCYELATPLTYQLTPHQIQTLVGVNNVWSEQGDIELSYHIPITNLLVKRQDVDDVSGNWLTLYSQPIEQASDMDFTFIDFLNQYGKTYKYALVPLLTQTQSGVEVEVEGGYTVSDEVQSIFDGVFISDSTGSQKCKANVGYGNVNMNQSVGSITPIGSQYPIIVTNSNNRYHNGSISGMIVPDDYYYNGNLSRIDMVNKRNELEQFLTNKRAKIIKDWNSNIWLVMIMDNIDCSFDNNYGMGIVTFNANWLEVGDPTNQEDLQATGLVDVGGV